MDPEIEARLNRPKNQRMSRTWAPVNTSSSVSPEKEPIEMMDPGAFQHVSKEQRKSVTQNLGVGGGGAIQGSLLKQLEAAAEIDRQAREAQAAKRREEEEAERRAAEAIARASMDAEEAALEDKRRAEEAAEAQRRAEAEAIEAAAEAERRRRPSYLARLEMEAAAKKAAEAAAVEAAKRRAVADEDVRGLSQDALRELVEQVPLAPPHDLIHPCHSPPCAVL